MDSHGFPWIFMDSHGFPWILMESHGCSWILMDLHGFCMDLMDLGRSWYGFGIDFLLILHWFGMEFLWICVGFCMDLGQILDVSTTHYDVLRCTAMP